MAKIQLSSFSVSRNDLGFIYETKKKWPFIFVNEVIAFVLQNGCQ
jgi:hypothetical protein